MDTIQPSLLQHPVHGQNLGPATFGEALGDQATLLVFLRHLG
jgi:hypothetical protein